jgi:hypothetical protein
MQRYHRTVKYIDDNGIIRDGVERVYENGNSEFVGNLERMHMFPYNYDGEARQFIDSMERQKKFERNQEKFEANQQKFEADRARQQDEFRKNNEEFMENNRRFQAEIKRNRRSLGLDDLCED